MTIDHRLATYGTLRPGECNHHQLAGLSGGWEQGTVRGELCDQGWGAALGHPAITLTEAGDPVTVALFTSPDLPAHWARLDAFEGEGYQRVAVTVETSSGPVDAWIYALADGGVCAANGQPPPRQFPNRPRAVCEVGQVPGRRAEP